MGVAGKRSTSRRAAAGSRRRRRSSIASHPSSASLRNLSLQISANAPQLPPIPDAMNRSPPTDKHRLDRPLPAAPSSIALRRVSSSSFAVKDLKPPKHRDRNRLKKGGMHLYKSLDRLTISPSPGPVSHPPLQAPSSAFSFRKHVSRPSNASDKSSASYKYGMRISPKYGDPKITPKPLNIVKPGASSLDCGRDSIEFDETQIVHSRWSTSTSDVASGIFLRKESKKRIFGLPISFKRRVKSEQLTPRAKVSSGFFGGKFGASKLQLPLGKPEDDDTAGKQWQSSRASSSMTIRGNDGTSSDDDFGTSFMNGFMSQDAKDETPKEGVPQRRHTLTGNLLLNAADNNSETQQPVSPDISRHASVSSSSDVKKGPAKGFFSLFPRPPKRDPSEVMQMLAKNATMPLIVESPEHSAGERPRGMSNPLPVNLRPSGATTGHKRNNSDSTYRPHDQSGGQPYPPEAPSNAGSNSSAQPSKRKVVDPVLYATPHSTMFTAAHMKPVLSHLDLHVTADIDRIEIGERRDIWAVVEISGSLANNNRETMSPSIKSLDVVFLLDLTQNMSEQAVATMKATVSNILENLTGTRADNFGMAAFTSTSACEVLMPMVTCSHQAKHRAFMLLDSLRTATDPCSLETPISNVVRAACSMFMPGVNGKNKNLIILSSVLPAHQSNMVDVCGFDDVKVHVIGVGCIYWPVSETLYADARRDGGGGFCFPTAAMDVTTSLEDESNHQAMQLQAIARRFVRALRSEKSIGMMRDVQIRLRPGENVTIHTVVGKTDLATLRPGERATVLVRMTVTSSPQKHSPKTEEGLEAIEEGLYAVLGMQAMPLLSAAVAYKHSLLPPTTTLTTTAAALATIVTRDSPWTTPSAREQREKAIVVALTPRQSFVRKALVQKIAAGHRNPKDALAAVENVAHTTGEKDLDYCNVLRELQYQIRVWNGRRRGRLMNFGRGASNVNFRGGSSSSSDNGKKASDDGMIRPFSFEKKNGGSGGNKNSSGSNNSGGSSNNSSGGRNSGGRNNSSSSSSSGSSSGSSGGSNSGSGGKNGSSKNASGRSSSGSSGSNGSGRSGSSSGNTNDKGRYSGSKGPATPALTSDNSSGDESSSIVGLGLGLAGLCDLFDYSALDMGPSGSTRKQTQAREANSSPMTVIVADPEPAGKRAPDPASRLWKRIEMAGGGDVGSIGGGSVGAIERVAGIPKSTAVEVGRNGSPRKKGGLETERLIDFSTMI